MEATYYQLHPTQRAQALRLALDLALASLSAPCSTAELVSQIARPLAVSKAEEGKLSRDVVKLADTYAARGQAVRGQPFQKYGRTMQRWNWLPPGLATDYALTEARVLAHMAQNPVRTATEIAEWRRTPLEAVQCLTCPRVVATDLLVDGVCPSCRE